MKLKFLIACVVALTSCSSFALEQQSTPVDSQAIPNQSAPQTSGRWPTPEESVAKMSGSLNLSDDQKSKITPIIADRQAQMKELMADTSGRKMQKMRKAKSTL